MLDIEVHEEEVEDHEGQPEEDESEPQHQRRHERDGVPGASHEDTARRREDEDSREQGTHDGQHPGGPDTRRGPALR